MGCSTQYTKDFIQILKLAEEIINLLKAAILCIISHLPTRMHPKRSNTALPALSAGRVSCHIPPPSGPRVFGWLLYLIVD